MYKNEALASFFVTLTFFLSSSDLVMLISCMLVMLFMILLVLLFCVVIVKC
jgi:hypothetical protein